jgi:flagellin
LSIETQPKAQITLQMLSRGLDYLGNQRAQLGAQQNRLNFADSVVLTTSENISEALSQVQDADIAQEVSELIRAQILQSSGIAVLSQANIQYQLVMGLLRF